MHAMDRQNHKLHEIQRSIGLFSFSLIARHMTCRNFDVGDWINKIWNNCTLIFFFSHI